jgi:excisionase family DNA binding protein
MSASDKKSASTDAPGVGEPLLDVDGAAAYLGMTEKGIRRRVQERTIPYYKVGRLLRFRRSELDAWLSEQAVAPEGK